MALQSPEGLDTDKLREEIREVYAQVVKAPDGDFHFHRGLDYAVEFLNIDPWSG